MPLGGEDLRDFGRVVGQRARFVEKERVDLRILLQRAPVLDQQPAFGGVGNVLQGIHRRQDADAHADMGVDEHRRRYRSQERQQGQRGVEHRAGQGVGPPLAPQLNVRLAVDRMENDVGDLSGHRLRSRFLDPHQDPPADQNGIGEDGVSRALVDRNRLSSQGALIDGRKAGDDRAVDGNDRSRMKRQNVAGDD